MGIPPEIGNLPERELGGYRGTSLIRNSAPPGLYSKNMHKALWWSWGGGLFLMSVVSL